MKVFVLLLFIVTVLSQELDLHKFRQHDYQLIFERANILDFDKKYMNYAKVISFKYNRTNVALNGTFNFKINVGSDLLVNLFYVIKCNKFLTSLILDYDSGL
ncbi:hypothetical protein ILUMI_20237 [Ignelater luminosus]|uniref:Uncharacterized protein n=1 Tax=Ignelater luminosus TaxID=2038154 RepID=A0A8K0FZ40_IGNLU|nr:hypothetical protein ILUMI_20237 [Ignelater luminosus]